MSSPHATRALWLALAVATACHDTDEPPTPECRDTSCDLATSRVELEERLAGHETPLAAFLRSAAADDGSVQGDYRAVLAGVGDELGCSTPTSFMVLSNDALAPKPILTQCAGETEVASQFFLALSRLNANRSDVDPEVLHIAAWDRSAKRYRHYAGHPGSTPGTLQFGVEPSFCLACHGGPEKLTVWQPLMNEMSEPWAQWVAEPDFRSFLFDEHLSATIASGAVYQELAAKNLLGSARTFERIVRTGLQQFTAARIPARNEPIDVARAKELLRPMFCDESINYTSEAHGGGRVSTDVWVDRSTQKLLRDEHPNADWRVFHEHATLPAAEQSTLSLIPIRGTSTEGVEQGLVANGILQPTDVLRVRAIDWQTPVGSQYRCRLFRDRSRLLSSNLAGAADVVIPQALNELLRDLAPKQPGRLVSLAHQRAATREVTTEAFGELLDEHIRKQTRAGRDALLKERRRRYCSIAYDLPTAPIVPGLQCD